MRADSNSVIIRFIYFGYNKIMQQFTTTLAPRLLDIIDNDILPLTLAGVANGNKVFGAAVVRIADGALIHAATNHEHSEACPLWHGEMVALRDFFALPNHPPPNECLLLSTHEPCPMCASAIAWSGMPQCFFLFDYDDTKKQFDIPHDIRILRELFTPATALNHNNAFFTARPLIPLLGDEDKKRLDSIRRRYDDLSQMYQSNKSNNSIPLK